MNVRAGRQGILAAMVIAWCVAATPVRAQEVFSSGPATFLTRFAFEQLTGGVILFKAGLDNGRDSLNFILDTGSGGISLDSTTAHNLNLTLSPSERTIRGIAGVRNVEFANDHTLNLPGLAVDHLNFHINDYELLSGVYGIKIDGIVGYSFLRNHLVKINYDMKWIEVFSPGDIKYPKGGFLLKPVIAGLPMQFAEVKDNSRSLGRFYLDTGGGLCLLFSNDYVSDSLVFKPSKRRYPTVAEGIGGRTNMDLAVLKYFKLGKYTFRKVPIYLFDDQYNVTSYPQLGGLIGNDILRRFNVILNYPRSEIHLMPNTHYRDPFDYSYTGLALYQLEGHIEISEVLPKSPAEEAGLKVGDVVVAIDNNLSNSMQAYKNILMESGRKVKLVIQRGDELIMTTMEIRKIR